MIIFNTNDDDSEQLNLCQFRTSPTNLHHEDHAATEMCGKATYITRVLIRSESSDRRT